MAHDGSGTGWDTAAPANTDDVRNGALEIRDLRVGVALRADKEHVAAGVSSAGGEHKAGSAIPYYQEDEPTLRPDGSTALDSDDAGRLWVDSETGVVSIYDGTEWIHPGNILAASGAYTVDTTYSGSSTGFVTVLGSFYLVAIVCQTGGGNFIAVGTPGNDITETYTCVDTSGTTLEFEVNCDQDTQIRFRIKSTNYSGNVYYRVL
jgi:hypothetical protein